MMPKHQRDLWRTTIETLEEMANSNPCQDIPMCQNKLTEAAEILRDRLGEALVDHVMVERDGDEIDYRTAAEEVITAAVPPTNRRITDFPQA